MWRTADQLMLVGSSAGNGVMFPIFTMTLFFSQASSREAPKRISDSGQVELQEITYVIVCARRRHTGGLPRMSQLRVSCTIQSSGDSIL